MEVPIRFRILFGQKYMSVDDFIKHLYCEKDDTSEDKKTVNEAEQKAYDILERYIDGLIKALIKV